MASPLARYRAELDPLLRALGFVALRGSFHLGDGATQFTVTPFAWRGHGRVSLAVLRGAREDDDRVRDIDAELSGSPGIVRGAIGDVLPRPHDHQWPLAQQYVEESAVETVQLLRRYAMPRIDEWTAQGRRTAFSDAPDLDTLEQHPDAVDLSADEPCPYGHCWFWRFDEYVALP